MPKPAPKRKAVKKTPPRTRASASKRPPKVTPPSKKTSPSKKEEAAYLETLIKTGQAAPVSGGKLPPGATHALVRDEEGGVKAVRRRFSIS